MVVASDQSKQDGGGSPRGPIPRGRDAVGNAVDRPGCAGSLVSSVGRHQPRPDKPLSDFDGSLTEAALSRNFDRGLLARDRTLAASIVLRFRTFLDGGLLLPPPPA